MISRLLLAARTAARLRPRQVAARALRIVRRVVGPPRLRTPDTPPELRPELVRLADPLAERLASEPFRAAVDRARRLRDGTFEAVGRRLPVADIDWTGRPVSHLFTYHLHNFDDAPALALLAREGDAGAAARLRSLWEGWLGACGRGEGDGWDPYPTASRIPRWIRALVLLTDAPAADVPHLPPSLRRRLLASLWSQADRLRRTLEHDLAGNHLLRNRAALVWAAAALDAPPPGLRHAGRAFARELRRQLLADGMHEERTPAYHALALEDALGAAEVLRAVDLPLPGELLDPLRRMRRTLRLFVRPGDGGLHPFGDTTPHGPPAPDAVERLADDVLGTASSGGPGEGGSSEGGSRGGGSGGGGSREGGAWRLAEAGFAGVRTETVEVVLDCGPFGARHQPGHGHCDGLSFVLSLRGVPVVVDPGIAGYADDPHRRWARSTAAHNTVQVDGREQTEIWDTFRAARRARVGPGVGPAGAAAERGVVRLFGSVAPYHAPHVVHTREVVVLDDERSGTAGRGRDARAGADDGGEGVDGGGADGGDEGGWQGEVEIEIRDRVRDARGRRLDTRLHFAHDVTVREVGAKRWELRCAGGAVLVEAMGLEGVRWEQGLLFPAWGVVREGPVLHGWIERGRREVETFGFRVWLRPARLSS